jgi:hypothetical protein
MGAEMISIEDRFAILDLCARYNYHIDTGASESWADTFIADGVFDGPVGRAEGRQELIAFCDGLAAQFPGAMHFNDNHLFETVEGGVLHRCFLTYQMPNEDGTDIMLLGYEDDVVQVDGEWKFGERRVGPLEAL